VEETVILGEVSDETISLRQHQEAVLTLPENPTTGYRWIVSAERLEILDDCYRPNVNTDAGGGGTRTVRVAASQTGRAVLQLTLRRLWEDPGRAIEKHVYEFLVS